MLERPRKPENLRRRGQYLTASGAARSIDPPRPANQCKQPPATIGVSPARREAAVRACSMRGLCSCSGGALHAKGHARAIQLELTYQLLAESNLMLGRGQIHSA